VHVILTKDCGEIVTEPSEAHVKSPAVAAKRRLRLLPPARYRHPGDIIRLILAGLVFAGELAVIVASHATYAGSGTVAVTAVEPPAPAGLVLAGLVQFIFAAAAVAAVVFTLRYQRYRLLVSLAGGAVPASAALTGIVHLAGGMRPPALAAVASQWSWLTGASLVGPGLLAAAAAGTVAAAPWLNRPWRRSAWIVLWLAAAARLLTGADLTGVGMLAGPAISAVLLYRLATYWLPVAPGWLAWRTMLRREYV
jgi:hypothetical protein